MRECICLQLYHFGFVLWLRKSTAEKKKWMKRTILDEHLFRADDAFRHLKFVSHQSSIFLVSSFGSDKWSKSDEECSGNHWQIDFIHVISKAFLRGCLWNGSDFNWFWSVIHHACITILFSHHTFTNYLCSCTVDYFYQNFFII